MRSTEIIPLRQQRGDVRLGRAFVRYQSALGFAERWAAVEIAQTVRVLPDLEQARQQALYLIRSRQVEMEKRRRRQRGQGREFESLRDYRQGDELRDICWTATARRHQLTTRIFEIEKSQAVWIVLDAGRLLRAEVQHDAKEIRLAKLDYAVNAALSLAQVATQCGDRVGLLAYGRNIQQNLGNGTRAGTFAKHCGFTGAGKRRGGRSESRESGAGVVDGTEPKKPGGVDHGFCGDADNAGSD